MAVEMFVWLDNLIHGKHSQQELHKPNDDKEKPLLHRWLGCAHCDNAATRRFCERCYGVLVILSRAELPSCLGHGEACSNACVKQTVDLVIKALQTKPPRIGEGG